MTARQRLPNGRAHEVFAVERDGQKYAAGVGRFDIGTVAEVFLAANKSAAIQNFPADSAIVLSFALQHGADAAAIRRALVRNGRGEPGSPIARLLDLLAGEG